MKNFSDLSEQEILALAISLEEEDAHLRDFAEGLRDDYPASAQMFREMAAEESGHRHRLIDLYRAQFGEHIPLIRRQDVQGLRAAASRSGWCGRWAWTAVRKQAEMMELETQALLRDAPPSGAPTPASASCSATWPRRSASTRTWPSSSAER